MRLWTLFLPLLAVRLSADLAAPALQTYEQFLRIAPAPGAHPRGLSVTVAPLLDDAQWAFTQRWDDNLIDNLRVRDLLNRRRMRGSFYLNASDEWYGNESRYPFTGDPERAMAPALLRGGHSIGGHTLSHRYVPAMNRPEMFYETLGVRIDREVNSQSPINSFVFPFTAFRNDLEGDAVHLDIARQLINAGYIHVANQYFNTRLKQRTPLLDSWLLPCDGRDADPVIRDLMESKRQHRRDPVLCVCMHAWPAQWGGQALPKLDQVLKKWGGRRDWWYANANELSAYRWQVRHGTLEARPDPVGLGLTLRRFEPWDLGDDVPLTLRVSGAGPLTPTASLEGRPLAVTRTRGRGKPVWLVRVPHSPGHGLPQAYDWHKNHAGKTQGLDARGQGVIQDLASRLWLDGQVLRLRLHNPGRALRNLRVSWRLPLGTAPAPPAHRAWLPRGGTLDLSLPLDLSPDPLLNQGRYYAAVQVDALRDDRRLRLYSDVRAAAPPRDPVFPRGAFLVLGPLPSTRRDFDLLRFSIRLLKQAALRPCERLFKGQQACWEPAPAERAEPLHPEWIPAGGTQAPRNFYTWDPGLFYPHGQGLRYFLAADIESPREQTLYALYPRDQVLAIRINGQRQGRDRTLALKAGLNRLLIYYAAGTPDAEGQASFSMLNYGPYFRLVDKDGQRAADIRYRLPGEWGTDGFRSSRRE